MTISTFPYVDQTLGKPLHKRVIKFQLCTQYYFYQFHYGYQSIFAGF